MGINMEDQLFVVPVVEAFYCFALSPEQLEECVFGAFRFQRRTIC